MFQRKTIPGVKDVVIVASGKGGVGKSMVASNLAVALSQEGKKVGLIDADIFGPSIPKMFGVEHIKPEVEIKEKKQVLKPIEAYGLKLLSIGLLIPTDSPVIWRGPMASKGLKQLLFDTEWGELDVLVIDLPPGTSDIHLTISQELEVSGAIIVTTPQEVAILDVIKGINMFRHDQLEIPVLGLVENMAWFEPQDQKGKKYFIFGEPKGEKLAAQLHVTLLAALPIYPNVSESGDKGIPIVADKNHPFTPLFRQISSQITEKLEKLKANG